MTDVASGEYAGLSRHLVSVWNPVYSDVDAMGAHLRLLLDDAARARDGAHVWWGKIRSPSRRPEQELPHDDDLLSLSDALTNSRALEVQLYLTDYRSLYVAHVTAIEFHDVRSRDPDRVPSYYRERRLDVDCWFRVADIQRLATDLIGVATELAQLRNVHYDYKRVSLYGGMYDLPLVVVRPDGRRFFDAALRAQVIGDRLWAEDEAERSDAHAGIEADLRDNVIGQAAWQALHPQARAFVAAGERAFREHRHEPAYDFGPPVLVQFAKGLEIHLNALLVAALEDEPAPKRTIGVGHGQTRTVGEHALSLGQLATALRHDLRSAVSRNVERAELLTKHLPDHLDALAPCRNEGAHRAHVDRATAQPLRDQLLGIGGDGVLAKLGRVGRKR